MWRVFADEFLPNPTRPWGRFGLLAHRNTSAVDDKDRISADVRVDGEIRQIEGVGNGPISAFVDALKTVGVQVRVLDYNEHAMKLRHRRPRRLLHRMPDRDRVLWASASTPTP